MRDEFLSEEDLDLKNLPFEELVAVWNQWLEWAQATNEQDKFLYNHGVFAGCSIDPTNKIWAAVTV
jgi:hypothetical protein